MAWISRSGYLTQAEMENNADIIIAYCRANGFNDKTIAGLLANIENESTINPLRQEVDGAGFGLVQWTPITKLQNACSVLGISPYTDGDVQLQVLLAQLTGNPSSLNEWYTTTANISPYYNSGASSDMIGISASDFISNSMNWSSEKLAIMFMVGYERPNFDPAINHYQARMQSAVNWESYVTQSGFIPRLNELGIRDNFHYYSQNPLYIAGYGMPNCTCYAWGRFWEIGDPSNTGANKPINLPTSDGGQWWSDIIGTDYNTGQTPQLGAVICFSDNNGGSGHVAIVEEIANDGTITCSNSAYGGTFFFLTYITPINGRYDWSHYTCQGFIYNPYSYHPPTPPTPRF